MLDFLTCVLFMGHKISAEIATERQSQASINPRLLGPASIGPESICPFSIFWEFVNWLSWTMQSQLFPPHMDLYNYVD